MPGTTTPPVDGQTDTPPAAGEAAAAAATGKPPKTFTQEELDAILEARLKRAIPADYEDLKALKAERDAQADKDKSDLQKAQEAAALADAKASKALQAANARLRRAEIMAVATTAGAVDAETVAALLASSEDITVDDDGNVKGAKTAVAALLKDKPFLGKTAPAASGGEFRGSDPKDKAAKIAELNAQAAKATDATERKRLYAEVMELQLS